MLDRWRKAGLIDADVAARIAAFEQSQDSKALRWPVLLALVFGGLLTGAGILLFVSAHWQEIPPNGRVGLLVILVAVFHLAGVWLAGRHPGFPVTLHALGTVALGAAVFQTLQVFHLEESSLPLGLFFWAAGALIAWWLLRHWTQAAMAAILAPAWLASFWGQMIERNHVASQAPLLEGLSLLAIAYLSAPNPARDDDERLSLVWIGGLAVIPCCALTAVVRTGTGSTLPFSILFAGWAVAIGAPLLAAWLLRRRASWPVAAAAVWVVIFGMLGREHHTLLIHLWGAIGSLGLTAWGVKESRGERINLGIVGFALNVLVFYFSSLMDKMGRSLSLVGLGVLFLAGGWLLETTRRHLIRQIRENVP